jgi:hypothetical protein
MQYYVAEGMVPIQPSCAPQQMIKVCNSFFKWVLQVSQNKLYQPRVEGDFLAASNVSKNPYSHDFSADDSIKKWLTNYASAHLHDPSKGHTVILSVAKRLEVYESYANDFEMEAFFYFPKKKIDGVLTYFLPSRTHFMRCWRTQKELKHIVLRKYLRFSLCDDCIEFRERRRFATSEEERSDIKKKERTHLVFIHEERGSYYWRQNAAIFMKDEYMSIIADGADQSAYCLPHMIEIDKFSSSRRKMPVYLMGVLVYGFELLDLLISNMSSMEPIL